MGFFFFFLNFCELELWVYLGMILKFGTLGGMVVDGVCESVKNGHGVLGLGSGSGPCMGFGFSVCDWGKLIVE